MLMEHTPGNIMVNGNPNSKFDWIFVFCTFYELVQRLRALYTCRA